MRQNNWDSPQSLNNALHFNYSPPLLPLLHISLAKLPTTSNHQTQVHGLITYKTTARVHYKMVRCFNAALYKTARVRIEASPTLHHFRQHLRRCFRPNIAAAALGAMQPMNIFSSSQSNSSKKAFCPLSSYHSFNNTTANCKTSPNITQHSAHHCDTGQRCGHTPSHFTGTLSFSLTHTHTQERASHQRCLIRCTRVLDQLVLDPQVLDLSTQH